MKKLSTVLTLCFLLLAAGSASGAQNLLEVWADIKVVSFEKSYLVDAFTVSEVFAEIARLEECDAENPLEQKALAHLKHCSNQVKLTLLCPPDRHETIDRIFLKSAAPRPEKMRVKLQVTLDDASRFAISLIDHRLQIISENYVYSPASEPADYVFTWCPDSAAAHGIGSFIIIDRAYLSKTGDLTHFEPPREITDLLRELNMPKAAPATYQYDAGTGDIADDREKGTDILISAGFQPAEDFDSL